LRYTNEKDLFGPNDPRSASLPRQWLTLEIHEFAQGFFSGGTADLQSIRNVSPNAKIFPNRIEM
jgi:hypothetical protein